MSLHKKDWLMILGGLGAAMTGAGMFGLGPLSGMLGTAEGAAAGGAAAGTDAAATAGSQLASSGLFSQVPGVSAGSQQAAMLAAQNAGMGGEAANMTAQAAMPAVKSAMASGQIGPMQYALEAAKGDLAGLNDPSVLTSRLSTNASRFAGNAGKAMAMNALTQQPQQPQSMPMMPRPAGPVPMATPDEDVNQLFARAQQGDPVAADKLRRLMQQMRLG